MVFDILYNYFDRPLVVFLIIPLFFFLFYFIRKDFVKFNDHHKRRWTLKFWFFLSRFLIFICLIIAIASPFRFEEKLVRGDPFVKILVDNSTSFDLFDRGVGEKIHKSVKRQVKAEYGVMGSALTSNLGDSILENLKTGGTLLLVTDGQNNAGADLGDVVLYAQKQNTTINALQLKPKNSDWRIEVLGPDKTTANVENTFIITVDGTEKKQHTVRVSVDGKPVLDSASVSESVSFTQKLSDGYHRITAELLDEKDYFTENNIYYKTVKVVPKPKVLLVTPRESPLQQLFKDIYDLDVSITIPPSLEPYYAVILNDIPASALDAHASLLNAYATDGNGLFVLGGKQSYEKGDYKDSLTERMLPVSVGSAGKQNGDVSVVLVIDISASTSAGYGSSSAADVQKALALSVLKSLDKDQQLGVVAFHTEAIVVSPLASLIKTDLISLESKIKSLQPGGGTLIGTGLAQANELLSKAPGSKNIILISDGQTQHKTEALATAQDSAKKGIKIFTVGVGGTTDEYAMQQIADIGSGAYFKASESNNLKLLFGNPEEAKHTDSFGVVLFDKHHYITENLDTIDAKIYGYNEAVPKSTAKLLATTSGGDPLLSIWRFGLGRVSSFLSDDGALYASEMLTKKNSALLVRSLNWVIGDPERKRETYVDIHDTSLGKPIEIMYKTAKQPDAPDVTFYKVDENIYKATLTSLHEGHQSLLGAQYSIHYHDEYAGIGVNPALNTLVYGTGGKFFAPEDIDGIVEAIKNQSQRSAYQKWYYRWQFVLAAILLFLFDIFVRKMVQYRAS